MIKRSNSSIGYSILILAIAVLGLIGCELVSDPDSDDVAPVINSITLTPETVSPSVEAEMEVSVDFTDNDGDVTLLAIGGEFEVTANVANQAGNLRAGTIMVELSDWSLISVGTHIIEVSLTDANGNQSISVNATANVSNTP